MSVFQRRLCRNFGRSLVSPLVSIGVWEVFSKVFRRQGVFWREAGFDTDSEGEFGSGPVIESHEGTLLSPLISSLLSAHAFRAARIVIVDVDDERLSIAKSLGADAAVKVSTNPQDLEDEVSKIKKAMKTGVDVSFDCVGFNKTMSTTLNAARPGGKVCLVGMGHGVMTVPLTPATAREIDVVGIFRYKNTWPL